jgi:hypothetical protein
VEPWKFGSGNGAHVPKLEGCGVSPKRGLCQGDRFTKYIVRDVVRIYNLMYDKSYIRIMDDKSHIIWNRRLIWTWVAYFWRAG